MNKAQKKRFDLLYQKQLDALKRQGKSKNTIDAYSRAIRRITEFFDLCPDQLTPQHLKDYFLSLIDSHSWSTVKVDRNGLQFFYKHVLNKQWEWVDIIKPPVIKSLPDILTQKEISLIINSTRVARYQAFIFTTYTMGLRLGETLNLRVSDIDAELMRVHVRLGKGKKDRFVILPQATLQILRQYWSLHRNKQLIFPNGKYPDQQKISTTSMDRGGLQKSFKAIVKSCGINKQITIHSLRHCYGTHLVETGLNLRAIQQAMGHECPKTTARYTQLTDAIQQNSQAVINSMVNNISINLGEE